jgi:S1-C subfamily serine protease
MTDPTSPHPSLSQLSHDFAALVTGAATAVVSVDGGGRRPSSGLVWQPGVIVTAEETVAEDRNIAVILPGGQRVEATLAGRDPSTDIAVLRYDGAAPPRAFGAATAAGGLQAGQLAVAIGSADGSPVATLGMVSYIGPAWESRLGGHIDARVVIGTRLPAIAEGGALVSADGHFIGMAVFGPRRRVLAIPASTIARVVPVILDKGHISRGYLGVGLQRVSLPGTAGGEPRRGAMVVTLDPDGPAKAAGIHQGDIIVAVGGGAVSGPRSLYHQLGPEAVGKTFAVDLVRAGAAATVDVTIAPRPAAA